MRLQLMTALIVGMLVSTPLYARLYTTGNMGTKAVLPPGARLVAGNKAKNEFFILAPSELAHAMSHAEGAPAVKHLTVAMKHAMQKKQPIPTKLLAHKKLSKGHQKRMVAAKSSKHKSRHHHTRRLSA